MRVFKPVPILFFFLFLLGGCTFLRTLTYNVSGIKDYRIFPAREFDPGQNVFQFLDGKGMDYGFRATTADNRFRLLDDILPKSETVAFLIIRNDSLLYERYFGKYDEASIVASFSMAKSYVSALVGIALNDGKIGSIEDSMTYYLPELQNKGLGNIRIRHLLQMTTGIAANEGYLNPFSDAAKLYYTRDLNKLITHVEPDDPAGFAFDYQSMNTQLLGEIVTRVTGKNLADYLQEKILGPMGTEFSWSWSLDSKKGGMEKAFCCINARARDYARFGRLYLNKGKWNGQQLLPQSWVEASTRIEAKEGASIRYQYQWWIPSDQGDFSARGLHGQYIYVNPEKQLIIVRLGKSEGKENWIRIFREIAGYKSQPVQNQ